MNCLDSQALLQRSLDGEAVPRTDELDAHLAQCADCRELHSAARLLQGALAVLPQARPTSLLTPRIVAAALEDRKRRQYRARFRAVVTAGLAAAVLLLMVTSYLLPPPMPDGKGPVITKDPGPAKVNEPEPGPAFARRAEDARQAMASLGGRVAETSREQARRCCPWPTRASWRRWPACRP